MFTCLQNFWDVNKIVLTYSKNINDIEVKCYYDFHIGYGEGITGYTLKNKIIIVHTIDEDGYSHQYIFGRYKVRLFKWLFRIQSHFDDNTILYIMKNFKQNKTNNSSSWEVEMSKMFWCN